MSPTVLGASARTYMCRFTPLAIAPAEHGADVVCHSLTKFINGASDFIAGAVCGSANPHFCCYTPFTWG